jgi:hypothetical protein
MHWKRQQDLKIENFIPLLKEQGYVHLLQRKQGNGHNREAR